MVIGLLAALSTAKAYAGDDAVAENVVIDERVREFTIEEKHGDISCVKVVDETTYTATRTDSYADALTMYGDHISVDKASAPGAKPYYRSWESSDAFYDGARICYMRIPLEKGKKAKATFRLTYRDPEHFCRIFLTSSYHSLKSRTTVKVPPGLASRVRVTPYYLTDAISFSADTLADGSVSYTAESRDMPPYPSDDAAPSPSVSAPQLIVTGQFPDVGALYSYLKKFTGSEDYSDPGLKSLASEIAAGCGGSRTALIDSVTSWVRSNIRYLAVEHGEYAFRPDDPAEVLRKKAGDCKGSAHLIKALLRLNGLDGRLVWLGTRGDVPFDWDAVPALCSGNHVIAACLLPDTTIYIDGTAARARPGYIPPSIRGSRTMIEDGDNFILSRVPDPGIAEDSERLTADFRIEGNDLKGEIALSLSGVERISFLSVNDACEPRRRQTLCRRLLAYPKKNSDVGEVNVTAGDSTVTLRAQVTEKNSVSNLGDRIYVDLKPLRQSMMAPADTAGRKAGIEVPFGYTSSYTYSIRIPDGYSVESLPDSVRIDDSWHDATLSYSVGGDRILCSCEVSTRSLAAPREKVADRNEGIICMKKASDSQIVLARDAGQ